MQDEVLQKADTGTTALEIPVTPLHQDRSAPTKATWLTVQHLGKLCPERVEVASFFEIVYIQSGSALCHYLCHTYPVRAGAIVTAGPAIPRGFTPLPDDHLELIRIQFNIAALGGSLIDPAIMSAVLLMTRGHFGEANVPGLFARPTAHVVSLIEQLRNESQAGEPGARTVMKNLLRMILVELYRNVQATPRDHKQDLDVSVIVNILPLIHAEATSPGISKSRIAAAASLSPAYFGRKFKSVMGETFSQYVQRIRVYRAIRMLRTTAMPVEDVAAAVGYSDPGAFRKIFRRVTGKTPSEFRQEETPRMRV